MNKFSSNLIVSDSNSTSTGTYGKPVFGRVKDIILDEAHPEFQKYNTTGVIKFETIGRYLDTKKAGTAELPEAYPLSSNIRHYPLINEIVILTVGADNTAPVKDSRNSATTIYYQNIISIWNNPNHNGLPSDYEKDLFLGTDIEEIQKIKELQPYPGDIIIEGRQGQSIRLSGYKSDLNALTDSENNGDPFMIISNGHQGKENKPTLEDINKDKSSIYLTSNHTVPLEQIRDKHDSLNTNPVLSNSYKGSQIIVNSGRLIFNAKEEDINFTSNNTFSISSKNVGIDAVESIGLDADKIHLGKQARILESEPVILGDSLETWLFTLTNMLSSLADSCARATTPTGGPVLSLIEVAPQLKAIINSLNQGINPGGNSRLKSKKVYTE